VSLPHDCKRCGLCVHACDCFEKGYTQPKAEGYPRDDLPTALEIWKERKRDDESGNQMGEQQSQSETQSTGVRD